MIITPRARNRLVWRRTHERAKLLKTCAHQWEVNSKPGAAATIAWSGTLLTLLLIGGIARADHTIERLPVDAGEMEAAALGHLDVDDAASADEASVIEAAVSRALNDRIALALGIAADGRSIRSMNAESATIGVITRLSRETHSPWQWGAIIEYSRELDADRVDALALGVIIGRSSAQWTLTTNFETTRELTDAGDKDWEASLHLARSVRNGMELGLEAFDAPATDGARERQIGPCLHVSWPWGARLLQIGLTGLLGTVHAAPDTTLLLSIAISR
jgi:hypothetical protein